MPSSNKLNTKKVIYNKYQFTKYIVLKRLKYIGLYYWSSKKNFGDLLGPTILNYFGIPYFYAPIDLADAVSVGSILEKMPTSFDGAVLGSGFIQDGPPLSLPNAQIYGVRGNLTKDRVIDKNINFIGDPGLLINEIFNIEKKNKYDLGIIPHYSDKNNKDIEKAKSKINFKFTIIDIESSPKEVITKISECENIISSSLHGIIASHSIGVPSSWIKFSNKLKGGSYKFKDYFSIYNIDPSPIDINKICNLSYIKKSSWAPKRKILNKKNTDIRRSFLMFKNNLS
jgi:hypothetical protein